MPEQVVAKADEADGTRLWIRSPLAILAANADGGLVVEGGRIVELVPVGACRPRGMTLPSMLPGTW